MPRIFNTIRQRMLAQNRFTRYLVYAIGEIVLVVVGIFLGLQLHNWNNDGKRAQQELALLTEMRQNLMNDLDDCRDNITSNERWRRSQVLVLEHLEQRSPFHDSLRFHYANLIGATKLTMNTSAYDNLKTIGFDLVRNDSLRQAITGLYAERYRFVAMTESEYDTHFQMIDMGPHIYTKLVVETVWKSAYPIDVEALRGDNGFKGVLRMNIFTKGFMTGIYKAVAGQIQALITQIDTELEQRRP